MQKKEIQKTYIKKINTIRRYDKAYFANDKPLVSDKDYDDIKKQVLEIRKVKAKKFICEKG